MPTSSIASFKTEASIDICHTSAARAKLHLFNVLLCAFKYVNTVVRRMEALSTKTSNWEITLPYEKAYSSSTHVSARFDIWAEKALTSAGP